jgi:hypothetical protein
MSDTILNLKRARHLLNSVMRDLAFGDELLQRQVESLMADAQLNITKAQLLVEVMTDDSAFRKERGAKQ